VTADILLLLAIKKTTVEFPNFTVFLILKAISFQRRLRGFPTAPATNRRSFWSLGGGAEKAGKENVACEKTACAETKNCSYVPMRWVDTKLRLSNHHRLCLFYRASGGCKITQTPQSDSTSDDDVVQGQFDVCGGVSLRLEYWDTFVIMVQFISCLYMQFKAKIALDVILFFHVHFLVPFLRTCAVFSFPAFSTPALLWRIFPHFHSFISPQNVTAKK